MHSLFTIDIGRWLTMWQRRRCDLLVCWINGLRQQVKPGDQMYLDASPQHSPPHQVPYKLASRWMGPYRVLEVRGPVVHLELPPELGKISPWVNVRRLKLFEQRDAEFSDFEAPVTPVQGGDGALRYEIHRMGAPTTGTVARS